MTDLTQNTTIYDLLSDEDKEQLKKAKEAGEEIFYYSPARKGFRPRVQPSADFAETDVYRILPPSPKPRVFWLNVYPDGTKFAYDDEYRAKNLRHTGCVTIKVVEEL